MSARRRIRVSSALLLCLVFAGIATVICLADVLFLGHPVSADGIALRTIRVPFTGYFEKLSPVAEAELEMRKIRIAAGEMISESDQDFITAYLEWSSKGLGKPIGLFVFFLIAAYILSYLAAGFGGPHARTFGSQVMMLGAMAVILAGAKAFLLYSSWSELYLPAVALVVFGALHLEKRFAFQLAIFLALLLSSLTGFDYQTLLIFLTQTLVVVAVLRGPKLLSVMAASIVGGVASGLMFVVSSLVFTGKVAAQLHNPYGDLYGPVGGCLVGGLLGYLAVAPLERLFGTASRGRLAELADFNHQLLKELRDRAPGTWQHSIAMANLAEEAADAIHANGFLCRVAAYYHDIGKMLNPRFFTENQGNAESPHDSLPPQESAEIIINHVVDGVKLAAKHKIPRIVADFIPMHHGSTLIAYFYDKAMEGENAKSVTRDQFTYKGERPNTPETGIMMIVDAVEATSRTLKKATPKSVERMVEHVIFSKMLYGQLDESELGIPELKTIALTLVDAIIHARHDRVQYPWQKDEEAAAEEGAPAGTPSVPLAASNSGQIAVPVASVSASNNVPAPSSPGGDAETGVEPALGSGRISYPKDGGTATPPASSDSSPHAVQTPEEAPAASAAQPDRAPRRRS